MELNNAEKSKHGRSAQNSIESILEYCKRHGYIAKYEKDYHIGRKGFSNQNQFHAPFLIIFADKTCWAVFSTTSFRSDRVKGQQWDAINLKEANSDIDYVCLVYPDGLKDSDKRSFANHNSNYLSKKDYSAIDAVISQSELSDLIEGYAIKDKNSGQIKDIQGNSFESRVADTLSFPANLKKWKNNDNTVEGMHFDLFSAVIDCFALDASRVSKIVATSDKKIIGRLPSGGNPKTDVLVTVSYTDGSTEYFTISCKRSSDSSVSVHQYNADKFADVLDKNNDSLRSLLKEFQRCGNLRDFGKDNCNALTKELKPYIKKLSLWVLGGEGGDGDPKTQNARFILTYDNNDGTAAVSRVETYYRHLVDKGVIGHFGTPFSWTYPSKRKGKDIQLKCMIIK